MPIRTMRKHYAVNWEDGKVVSIEVNGVRYADPVEITDRRDRTAVLRLLSQPPPKHGELFDDAEFDAEVSRLQRETAHMPRVIVGVFLGVALVMLVIAVISGVVTGRALAREQSAPGWVVDVVPRTDSSGQTLYYPIVEFTPADGTSQTVLLAEGSAVPSYRTGQEIVVRYDRDRPSAARIPSLGGTILLWLGPLITGFLALAFLGATVMSIWLFKTE